MFNAVDTPRIGKKHTRGSSSRYKKLFCLRCMVSYSNDYLHICQGRCHRCLERNEDHTTNYGVQEIFCENCGRYFWQEACFESHKSNKLKGEFKSYCEFLRTLHNCDECRKDFNLAVKCRHFGKK